jgi:RNA polymerase sigma-70 factor, ECF subfamily
MDCVLREIERAYRRDLLRFVRIAQAIVGDRRTAEEVVHDAFASAIGTRASFRGEGPIEAWLWRAVVNAARRAVRDAGPRSIERAADSFVDPPSAGLTSISPLVAQLPERQRLVVFLRYYADLDYRGIAEVLDVTVGTVSASLATAHATLRNALEATSHG